MRRHCLHLHGPTLLVLNTFGPASALEPTTKWMPVAGMGKVDFYLDVRNISGNIQVKPAYQLAEIRTDRPDEFTIVTNGSAISGTDGDAHYREDISSEATAHMFVRFGVAYSNTSGSALGRCDATLIVATRAEGAMVGAAELQLNPVVNSTDVAFHPIGDFRATLDLDKIQAAFIVKDKSGNLEYALAIRTATDKQAPNSWAALEASYTSPAAGNTERMVSGIDPDTVLSSPDKASENMWFQPGVAVKGNTGLATIHVAIAATRS